MCFQAHGFQKCQYYFFPQADVICPAAFQTFHNHSIRCCYLVFKGFFFLMLKRNAVKFMGKWEFGTSYQANENLCWGVTERDSHAGKNLKCYQLLELLNCTSALDFSTFLSFIGCFGTFLSLWSWINYTSFPPGLECSRAAVRLCLFANCSL